MLDDMRSSPATVATSKRTAYLLLVLLSLVWGIHWPVVKAGLSELPPFTYGAFRVGSALLVVALLLAVRGRLRLPHRADLGVIVLVGLGQIGGSIILMNLALQVVPAGRLFSRTRPRSGRRSCWRHSSGCGSGDASSRASHSAYSG